MRAKSGNLHTLSILCHNPTAFTNVNMFCHPWSNPASKAA